MERRALLAATGTALSVGVAGCSDAEPEPEPEPASSELRIDVENESDRAHAVTFLLRITRDRSTVVEAFETGEIGPDETWTWGPETLDPGEYALEIDIPTLDMHANPTWGGHECPVKEVDIELRPDGFRMRAGCRDE